VGVPDTVEIREHYLNYYDTVFSPGYYAAKPYLEKYAETGKYIEHSSPEPSASLLRTILRSGKLAICYMRSHHEEGFTHAVALLMPSGETMPHIYIPDEAYYGGSQLKPLTAADKSTLIYSNGLLAVS